MTALQKVRCQECSAKARPGVQWSVEGQGGENNKRPTVPVRSGIYIHATYWKRSTVSPKRHTKHAMQGDGAKLVQRKVEPRDVHQAEKDSCVHERATKGGGPA